MSELIIDRIARVTRRAHLKLLALEAREDLSTEARAEIEALHEEAFLAVHIVAEHFAIDVSVFLDDSTANRGGDDKKKPTEPPAPGGGA